MLPHLLFNLVFPSGMIAAKASCGSYPPFLRWRGVFFDKPDLASPSSKLAFLLNSLGQVSPLVGTPLDFVTPPRRFPPKNFFSPQTMRFGRLSFFFLSFSRTHCGDHAQVVFLFSRPNSWNPFFFFSFRHFFFARIVFPPPKFDLPF